jgi:hypothetical protein
MNPEMSRDTKMTYLEEMIDFTPPYGLSINGKFNPEVSRDVGITYLEKIIDFPPPYGLNMNGKINPEVSRDTISHPRKSGVTGCLECLVTTVVGYPSTGLQRS